jgi:anti-sigma regulatory factor (Ser/Thr protein kinase)
MEVAWLHPIFLNGIDPPQADPKYSIFHIQYTGSPAMSALKKSYRIRSRDFIRAGEASIQVQTLLKSLSFDPKLIRRVVICGYEGEMNIVMHGGEGTLSFEIEADRLIMNLDDDGPGIEDIEKAMQAGFSTASDEHREMGFGAGMGLPNMKKNADDIRVESEKGRGTHVRMVFRINGQRRDV